ncbi:MAG TPA: methylmalonyl-CoA epimerase [bacterium]|nr:methylmalonyl-CoA epimerase [bacterium]
MSGGTPAGRITRPPRLAHVAVVVRQLEAAEEWFRDRLGLASGIRESLPSRGVRVAFVPIGAGAIELVQPTGAGGPLERFLATSGETVHHVAVEVPDIDAAMAVARSAGFRLIDATARPGAHGTKVAFVHPRSTHGLLVELIERPDGRDIGP